MGASAWSKFIVGYPAVWNTLVKQMRITSMGLDAKCAAKVSGSSRTAFDQFRCSVCSSARATGCAFATSKALQTHMRSKHKQRNVLTQYLDTSLTCPVCYVRFGNFPKLLGHVTEGRQRGTRPLSCHQVLKSGLVEPVPVAMQQTAQVQARAERSKGRKLGHTTPKVSVPAKRPRPGTIVPEMYRAVRPRTLATEDSRPCNAFDWHLVRPAKRLRTKSSLDSIVAHLCTAAGADPA
jgi:hypothetical protein